MEDFLNLIMSNNLYMLISAVILLLIIISIFKRLMKLFILLLIGAIGYFGYLYYTGEKPLDTKKLVEKISDTAKGIKDKGQETYKKITE